MNLRALLQMALLAGGLCLATPAQEAEIRTAEARWGEAVKNRDLAALEKIFDEGLIYAHSTGIVETKKEYIDRLRGGKQRYDQVSFEKTQVAMHGDAAVTLSWVRMSGKSNERLFNDHVMMTHVWVRKAGAWKLAAHQTTKLAE